MTKKSEEKFEYLKNSKSILGEIKSIFDRFKGHSVTRNSGIQALRPESAPRIKKTQIFVSIKIMIHN